MVDKNSADGKNFSGNSIFLPSNEMIAILQIHFLIQSDSLILLFANQADGDKSVVKRFVMQRTQTEAVTWI